MATRRGFVLMAALVVVLAGPSGSPQAAERVLERLADRDLPGGDYETLQNVPLAACEARCLGDVRCAGFTYNEGARWCFLKSTIGTPVDYPGATSARIATVEAAALPLPDISSLPDGFARGADRLEARAAAARPATAGLDIAGGASQEPLLRPAEDWLDLALRKLAETPAERSQRSAALSEAGSAAFLALRNAASEAAQARALRTLSAVLERQGLFRPAIEASEASLSLAPDPAEAERLDRLRATYGFRVLDYAVDAQSEAPRLCIQFSETLAGGAAELERFVALDGVAATTLSVSDKQLCVEGLEHGARYLVSVREGLPAATGETLRAAAEFRAYVRDRAPVARFQTDRYVLPAGSNGVPVTTINTNELVLSLHRVNDQNLAEVVRSGDFKRQVYAYEANAIAEERGTEVWSGRLEVDSRRNQEVTTLVPVAAAMGTVQPGVYVLTAQPVEGLQRSGALATQWFVVSDIGLTTFSADGTVDVFARSLGDNAPLEGVALTLLARNEAVLAMAVSDAAGHARLVSPRPAQGGEAPAVVTARLGEADYAFVDLTRAPFELTDRGVAGRTAPGPVDAFLATERGVYRPGATVHLTALVRDDRATALAVPVTFKLTRPDGKLSRSLTRLAAAQGGLALDLPLARNAARGTWTLTAHLDPEAPAVGRTTFLVEDFVPQRLAVSLTSEVESVRTGETVPLRVEADFLYGAPAAGLMLEGSVAVRQADALAAHPGYRFGLDAEPFSTLREPLTELPRTGADGLARLDAELPAIGASTGPLEAAFTVNVREPGGRQVGETLSLPLLTGTPVIGIRPLFEGDRVAEGSAARFAVIALDGARERTALDARWTLTRIERNFQWYRTGDVWRYDPVERLERVAAGEVEIGLDGAARIAVPTEWGRYRLEVTDVATGAVASSLVFSSGWVNTSASADTPDILEVHLDRERYAAGETARLRIVPRHAGRALVTVLAGEVAHHQLVEVPAEGTEVAIPVEADWLPGAYVTATLYRAPGGTDARPLPTRAVGVAYLEVDTEARRLNVSIEAPDIIRPRRSVRLPVRIDGLDEGERAHLTLAAVDIGILNLTGFEPPDPTAHYLGQRRLGVAMRDLYGELIDDAGAALGRLRSGGDGVAAGGEALAPNETPVALFSGLVETDAAGLANVDFELPAFDGSLKLMAIAWTDDKVGNASRDMTVRDPVVVAGALPRFLAPGDASRLRIDLHNLAHVAGDYALEFTATGPLDVDEGSRTLRLEAGGRASVEVPIAALSQGEGAIAVTLEGPQGLSLSKEFALEVRPAAAPLRQRRLVALSPGETTRLDASLTAGFDEEATVTVTIGASAVDDTGLIALLDRFPYGCAEQTVSRVLPLLALEEGDATLGLEGDQDVAERVEGAITHVLSYQSAAGGFGLWSPGTDLWLTAYVMDFLTRAGEAGHEVPAEAFRAGLDRLQSVLSFAGEVTGERGAEIAYATYVLARNGRAAIGDLRYFAEERIEDFASPLARAQLAASLAFAGDTDLSARLFDAAAASGFDGRERRTDYGTALRDAAAVLTLAAEAGAAPQTVSELVAELSRLKREAAGTAVSTQEAAWLVLASNASAPAGHPLIVDGQTEVAPVRRALTEADLRGGVPVTNEATEPLLLAATFSGTPLTPLPAAANGLTLERRLYTLDGGELSGDAVAQNERFVVRLTVTKRSDVPMRLMLTDLLPAGFEVENPRLVTDVAVDALPAMQAGPAPDYTLFGDDRFAAAWTLLAGGADQPMTVAYMVRAVSPGTFVRPAVEVVDMYQPATFARTEAGTLAVLPTR